MAYIWLYVTHGKKKDKTNKDGKVIYLCKKIEVSFQNMDLNYLRPTSKYVGQKEFWT